MKHKFSEGKLFETLEPQELLIANEMISWQIAELLALQWELNKEQTVIMSRYHELAEDEQPDEQEADE